MKYKLFFWGLLIIVSTSVVAQYTSDYHKIFGSPYSSSVNCICTDTDGNTYLAGEFNKNLIMGSYRYKDRWGGFIARLDINNEIVWMHRADMKIKNIEITGNVLSIFAQSSKSSNFAGHPIAYSGEHYMAVLASVNTENGEVIWLKELTGSADVFAADMTLGGVKNDIYITGAFRNEINLDGKTLNKTHEKNNFIAKISQDGKLHWMKQVSGGDTFVTGITISAIAANQYGDFAITGELSGIADFAGHCFDVTDLKNDNPMIASHRFVYVANFDSEGRFLRIHRAITEAEVTDMAFHNDQVYLCGYYTGAYIPERIGAFSIFGDTTVIDAVTNNKGSLLENWFVICFKGEHPYWHISTKGQNSSRALSIVADKQGNCYAGGFFYDHIILPNNTEVKTLEAPFTPGMLVMKISDTGELLWAKTADKPTGLTKVFNVSLNHMLVVCGEISGNAMFGNMFVESRGKHQNGFVAKFDL